MLAGAFPDLLLLLFLFFFLFFFFTDLLSPEVEVRYDENEMHPYNFDLIVIGGGSGGLACAKEAAKHKKLVAVCDYVKPSPYGTSWRVGGTCVNVGCIPKKLMHQAALLGEGTNDSRAFGWDTKRGPHSWSKLVEGIQAHIHSLNEGYIKQMEEEDITYINAYASFKDTHTIICTYADGKTKEITARRIVIAVGGRPRYPDVAGAKVQAKPYLLIKFCRAF